MQRGYLCFWCVPLLHCKGHSDGNHLKHKTHANFVNQVLGDMGTKFNSAVDWWYYGVIGFVVIVLAGTWTTLPSSTDIWSILIFFTSAVVALGLPGWMFFSTYYLIDGSELTIRSGPFKWIVDISTIQSVTPTRSPLSSPALSLNRLEIKYASDRVVLVSPASPEKFIEALSIKKR